MANKKDEVEAFLPSLDKARAAKASVEAAVWWKRGGVDLLASEPSAEAKLAVVLAVVRYHGDADLPPRTVLRYPYVPAMPFPLEEGTARLFERYESSPLPDCLRVEIERRGGGDPYRGIPSGAVDFHGFSYGDALEQARTQLAAMRASYAANTLSVETFAWPVLRLSYRRFTLRRELALVVRPDGVMHAMLCRGSWL